MADMVKFCAMASTDAASVAPPEEGLLPISPILPLVSASGARVLVLEQWVAFGDSLKVGPFFSCGLGAL